MTDEADTIALKIRRAKTDTGVIPSEIDGLEGRPEAKNLVTIYAALADMSVADVLTQHQDQGFGPFKQALTDVVVSAIAPIAQETQRLMQNEDHLISVLRSGAVRAQALAEPIVTEAEKIVGFIK